MNETPKSNRKTKTTTKTTKFYMEHSIVVVVRFICSNCWYTTQSCQMWCDINAATVGLTIDSVNAPHTERKYTIFLRQYRHTHRQWVRLVHDERAKSKAIASRLAAGEKKHQMPANDYNSSSTSRVNAGLRSMDRSQWETASERREEGGERKICARDQQECERRRCFSVSFLCAFFPF